MQPPELTSHAARPLQPGRLFWFRRHSEGVRLCVLLIPAALEGAKKLPGAGRLRFGSLAGPRGASSLALCCAGVR